MPLMEITYKSKATSKAISNMLLSKLRQLTKTYILIIKKNKETI